MHRLDICRAAQREFHQMREHDGRIAALVMRDQDILLGGKLGGRAVVFELSGVSPMPRRARKLLSAAMLRWQSWP
jgi:hypothetical protein